MIFVDSSFWIARMLPRDSPHRDVAALADARGLERLVTSSAVIAETWTFLRRRSGHRTAITWLDRVLGAGNVRCERIDEQIEAEAWAWLRVHDERPTSFVDATSFGSRAACGSPTRLPLTATSQRQGSTSCVLRASGR